MRKPTPTTPVTPPAQTSALSRFAQGQHLYSHKIGRAEYEKQKALLRGELQRRVEKAGSKRSCCLGGAGAGKGDTIKRLMGFCPSRNIRNSCAKPRRWNACSPARAMEALAD